MGREIDLNYDDPLGGDNPSGGGPRREPEPIPLRRRPAPPPIPVRRDDAYRAPSPPRRASPRPDEPLSRGAREAAEARRILKSKKQKGE